MVPPEEGEQHHSQRDGFEEACSKLVHSMAEPVTAIGNYIEAAMRVLSQGDAAEVHARLGEIIEKAQKEVVRASHVLNEMRQLIQTKKP
jgi:hypothetical protein